MFERPFFKWIYRWRVRTALIAFLVCLVLARPTWRSIAWGAGISAVGLLIRAWASGHLRKEKELAVSGPYRYSRNPLYLGNFVLGLSLAAGANSLVVFIIFAVYFLVFYPVIMLVERERMKRLFPDKYGEYQARVPAFFPWRRPAEAGRATRFDWELYKKNREYRALLGGLVYWVVLSARIILKV